MTRNPESNLIPIADFSTTGMLAQLQAMVTQMAGIIQDQTVLLSNLASEIEALRGEKDALFSRKQAATYLGVGVSTIDTLRKNGELGYHLISAKGEVVQKDGKGGKFGKICFSKKQLDDYLETCRIPAEREI